MKYTTRRDALYRSRHGLLFGVCRGVAEYFDISVFWTRALTVVATLFTGIWPVVILYLLAVLVMKRAPRGWSPSHMEDDWRRAGREALRVCRCATDGLDARLRRLERAAAGDSQD